METVKILFFVLSSFFKTEGGQIAADTTTVTIDPKSREIEIVQENLFTVMQSESDSILVSEQWKKLSDPKAGAYTWARDLDAFPIKDFGIEAVNNNLQTRLKLTYASENDLRVMGIWYDEGKNQFSVNHTPEQHITTKEGRLNDNYWLFDGDRTFSFTLEPFLEMPERFKKFKKGLNEIIDE
ncbi:hypothetical protein SAMN05421766_104444 [Zobellia uliginosa]|uniref:Uncharacterized protein n=1 Tax=Zobellia uliginosa TaxID=143224 RepID=A0ABY1KWE3_9FLAO|nr:hypothetical protein [Zobellia uliginosa]SIS86081.1 hypothetical protein SAMN05421766_104444 [Zobellia uliginosa]